MKKIIILAILIGCGFWAYYIYSTSEVVNTSYASYKDVEFDKGWIPRWIPKDSFDIHDTHNIDTNKLFITFKSKNYKAFLSACKKLNLIKIPQVLKKLNPNTPIKSYNFFTCRKNENYIVTQNLKKLEFYIFDK